MSDRWNGKVEIISSLAAKTEITQERSQGSDQLLRRASPTPARTLQQKLPHDLGTPLTYIVAQSMQQLAGAARVKSKSGLGRATMSSKPVAESGHQCRLIIMPFGGLTALADSALDQMPVKELHPKLRVVTALSAVRLRAGAT